MVLNPFSHQQRLVFCVECVGSSDNVNWFYPPLKSVAPHCRTKIQGAGLDPHLGGGDGRFRGGGGDGWV